MNRIIYKGPLIQLQRIVKKTNEILNKDDLYNELKKIFHFDYSNILGAQLADIIKNPNVIAEVHTYKGWIWSRVCGYNEGDESIYLNTRKFGRSDESIANTIVHEYIHVLDAFNKQYDFGHGSNTPSGKDNSAPYMVGNIFEEIYSRA